MARAEVRQIRFELEECLTYIAGDPFYALAAIGGFMAKPLVFRFKDADLPVQLQKVDRDRLYGFIRTEALDADGRPCRLATLADDGRTLISSGGTAIASLSQEGEWLDRGKLKAVDPEGHDVTRVASSYEAPVSLTVTATIDEFLTHNVKAAYQVAGVTGSLPDALLKELKAGKIFSFPYSYRGGLAADVGFLLTNAEGEVFLLLGTPTKLHFVGLEQASALTEEEPAAEEEGEDSVDFGMM